MSIADERIVVVTGRRWRFIPFFKKRVYLVSQNGGTWEQLYNAAQALADKGFDVKIGTKPEGWDEYSKDLPPAHLDWKS